MISKVLSRIFLLAAILMLLGGIGNLITQISLKTFQIKTSKIRMVSFGTPGITFNTVSKNNDQNLASDTTIHYWFKDSTGKMLYTGIYTKPENSRQIRNKYQLLNEFELKNYLATSKAEKYTYLIDTQVSVIVNSKMEEVNFDTWDSVNFRSLPDGRVVYNQFKVTWFTKNILSHQIDTFYNIAAAERHHYLNKAASIKNKIFDTGVINEQLRILPSNGLQHFIFLLYTFFDFLFYITIFYILYGLFKKFSHRHFFIASNVNRLKYIGFAIVVPQLLHIICYYSFFKKYSATKIFF